MSDDRRTALDWLLGPCWREGEPVEVVFYESVPASTLRRIEAKLGRLNATGEGEQPAHGGRVRRMRPKAIADAERLDIGQVERLVGYSRRTIERWCLTRGFPHPHYFRRKRLWITTEVRAWIAAHQLARPAETASPEGEQPGET